MSKERALMRDVITKYHPEFKTNKKMSAYGVKNPEIFNVELLMDQCLSAVGRYRYVDEYGRDFDDSDDSDGKTSTMRCSDKKLIVRSVECKIGSLRITAWNEVLDRLHFFYVPRQCLETIKTWAGMGKKEWICARWTPANRWYPDGHYNKMERYRVADFETLAAVNDQTFRYWGE